MSVKRSWISSLKSLWHRWSLAEVSTRKVTEEEDAIISLKLYWDAMVAKAFFTRSQLAPKVVGTMEPTVVLAYFPEEKAIHLNATVPVPLQDFALRVHSVAAIHTEMGQSTLLHDRYVIHRDDLESASGPEDNALWMPYRDTVEMLTPHAFTQRLIDTFLLIESKAKVARRLSYYYQRITGLPPACINERIHFLSHVTKSQDTQPTEPSNRSTP